MSKVKKNVELSADTQDEIIEHTPTKPTAKTGTRRKKEATTGTESSDALGLEQPADEAKKPRARRKKEATAGTESSDALAQEQPADGTKKPRARRKKEATAGTEASEALEQEQPADVAKKPKTARKPKQQSQGAEPSGAEAHEPSVESQVSPEPLLVPGQDSAAEPPTLKRPLPMLMGDLYIPTKPLTIPPPVPDKEPEPTEPVPPPIVDADPQAAPAPVGPKWSSSAQFIPDTMADRPETGPLNVQSIRHMEEFPFRVSPKDMPLSKKALFIDKALPAYFSNTDVLERERAHIVRHCDHILLLISDWLEKLDAIENTPPDEDDLPAQTFRVRVFEKLLQLDFDRASMHGFVLPDQRLVMQFDLSPTEIMILWIVASLQIDPNIRKFMAPVTPYGQPIYLNPAIVIRMLCYSRDEQLMCKSLLSSSSRLVSSGLLSSILYKRPTLFLYNELVIAEQVVNMFTGHPSICTEIAEYAQLQAPRIGDDIFLAANHEETVRIIGNFLRRPSLAHLKGLDAGNLNMVPSLAFFVEGLPGSGRNTLVKIISSRLEYAVITVNCSPLMSLDVSSFEEYLKALFLDAEILGCIICMRNAGPMLNEARMAASVAERLAKHAVAVALCIDLAQPTHACLDPYITFKTKIDADLKENAIAYWKPHVDLPNVDQSQINLKKLTDKLALQPFQIQKAAKLAYFASEQGPSAQEVMISNENLEKAASAQISKNIGGLAFITDPEITLQDVIVNDDIGAKLYQIIGSAKERRKVLYEWGVGKRIKRGTGIIALFDGEPGTGKTHSAEAIARELGLSLMRINIASLVDKYIGETEKNLTTIFEQARPDMSLLLFDEADSLFTKRSSSVSKSTDRYSNMSINVLLQLIERYEGVSVLTTNLKAAIDPAFERRITYKVYFPMPKEPERKRLWKYLCPPFIKTAEKIDYEWLSELELSGGEIKNAVLTAAYKAATLGQYLDNDLLYDAGVSEAVAAGRVTRRNVDDLPPNPIFD